MIAAILTVGAESGGDPVAELAVRFVESLVGGPPVHLVTLAHADAADVVTASDLVVVATPVLAGALEGRLRGELERYRHGLRLTGRVAFPLAVGGWPADGDIAELQLKPLLRAAGAACVAPGLHVSEALDASLPVVAAYCRYWRPALPALVRLAQRSAASPCEPPDLATAVPALAESG